LNEEGLNLFFVCKRKPKTTFSPGDDVEFTSKKYKDEYGCITSLTDKMAYVKLNSGKNIRVMQTSLKPLKDDLYDAILTDDSAGDNCSNDIFEELDSVLSKLVHLRMDDKDI
jgi:hypothetical protein